MKLSFAALFLSTGAAVANGTANSTSVKNVDLYPCMQDNWKNVGGNKQNLVCNAKEVHLVPSTLKAIETQLGYLQCTDGQVVTVTLAADVKFNAERWDPGWYVAADGGSALTGQCAITTLSKGTNYQTTNGGKVIWDKDEGTFNDSAGDLCGDVLISGGGGTILKQTEIIRDVPVKCKDEDGDGTLELNICFSWRVKGKDAACHPKALYPGSTSKCFCDSYNVDNIFVEDTSTGPSFGFDDDLFGDDLFGDDFFNVADGYDWDLDSVEFFSEDYPFPDGDEIVPGDDNCLNDVNWDEFVSDVECAAEEVEISEYTAYPQDGPTCVAGETVTVTVVGEIEFSGPRYNPAWFVATDGGDALSGQCAPYTLDPTGTYLSGGDYFTNGGSGSDTFCGDITTPGETVYKDAKIIDGRPILCEDQDGDGFMDVAVCFGWSEYDSRCDPNFPHIGSYSSCDCDRINLKEIEVIQPTPPAADLAPVIPAC